MIKLEAYQNNSECSLNPGTPISIGIPWEEESKENYEIFYGQSDEEGNVIWDDKGGIPRYINSAGLTPIGNAEDDFDDAFDSSPTSTATVYTEATFQGKKINHFVNYLKNEIDFEAIQVDTSEIINIEIFFKISPLGEIIDKSVNVNVRAIDLEGTILENEIVQAIRNAPDWEPAKYANRTRVGSSINFGIFFGPREEELSDWNRIYQSAGILSYRGRNYQFFKSNRLKWINCDAYVFKNKPRIDFKIKSEGIGNTNAYLIFKDYKSIMQSRNGKYSPDTNISTYTFSRIPKGEKVVAVVIKNVGDATFISKQDIETSNITTSVTDFKEIETENIAQYIENLNTAF